MFVVCAGKPCLAGARVRAPVSVIIAPIPNQVAAHARVVLNRFHDSTRPHLTAPLLRSLRSSLPHTYTYAPRVLHAFGNPEMALASPTLAISSRCELCEDSQVSNAAERFHRRLASVDDHPADEIRAWPVQNDDHTVSGGTGD